MRVGDKCVFGRDNTVNCFLDVEFGEGTIVADWVYICDFDHVTDDVHIPIKDQGIVKSPVRIGPDVWIGAKASVLRGTTVGRGCVIAAHAVVRGDVPEYSIVGGIPARVLKDRREVYDAQVARREALADIARKTAVAAELRLTELIAPSGERWDGGAFRPALLEVAPGVSGEATLTLTLPDAPGAYHAFVLATALPDAALAVRVTVAR